MPTNISERLLQHLFGDSAYELKRICLERNLIIHDPSTNTYRFRHELARLATKDRLSTAQQIAVHQKLMDYIKKFSSQDYNALVHHSSGANNAGNVLKYAPLAARKAAQLGAHREAADYWAIALRFVDHAPKEQQLSLIHI